MKMTIKDLIQELLDWPMEYEVRVWHPAHDEETDDVKLERCHNEEAILITNEPQC